ncbi:sporulation integral membrane protein YlbJ [Paenibacillus glufosinatiresistens]|uniref:sporulation integral membrane protein YlbJ n=1 Tax=Paenibacillus glufosinatiresistens TaxID=3070657 RepID=UPI00286EB062|nr:sporulation integral membrane protein YlbJ [Paenibacillus sp. YX.27]
MKLKKFGTALLAAVLSACMLLLLAFPGASLASALRGVAVWWEVLFPSLFPFFVMSELMLGLGVVHLFGALLDPLMRPLFRIPGSGGFAAAMGYVSGYPVGARLTAKLREQGLVTREEGERLVAFTTSSDPIFLLGAVSVGFFRDASLGVLLAAAHYGGGLLIGLLMRFHGRRDRASRTPAAGPRRAEPAHSAGGSEQSAAGSRGRLRQALAAMREARLKDGRSFGELLSGAVASSLQLIMVVGGLVVFFNVLMTLMDLAGILKLLVGAAGSLLHLLGFPSGLAEAVTGGVFEVTLGTRLAGEAQAALPYRAAAAAFVLSWGGLSVHAQVASILSGSGLRYLPFLAARFAHGLLAASLALLLWEPLRGAAPVWSPAAAGLTGGGAAGSAAAAVLLGAGAAAAALAAAGAIGIVRGAARRIGRH